MNKNLVILAFVATVLFVATPAVAQTYLVETQSPFWGQMNSVHDGTARAFNGIRRAMGQPERIRQPLFDDRVVERRTVRNQYSNSPYYAPQGAYYGEPRGSGVAQTIGQLLGGGQQVPSQWQGVHPCDRPMEYRPAVGSDTADCGHRQATKNDVIGWNLGTEIAGGAWTWYQERKTRKSMDKLTEAVILMAEERQGNEGAGSQTRQQTPASAPIHPRTVTEPQARGGEMVKVLNCTGAVLSITGKFAGETWTLQPGEMRTIETRSGFSLKATYSNGRTGQIVLDDSGTIAVHPSNKN